MLRRSHSAANQALLTQALKTKGLRSTTAKPERRPEFDNTTETCRVEAVKAQFEARHSYPPHTEQTEAFMHLLNGRPTILLAGTGFGKSRVPEMYFHAYDNENFSPIVLCINPLVSLGNDQVSEKEMVGLKAVNLIGSNCTKETCDAIIHGKYNFVYVSPEIALTNDVFDQMWRDARFQARLILKVVDEAHMIYEWGLVASGQVKRLASHTRVQDVGVFRPSYGDLVRRFLATDKVPLLMMSATLTPQAIDAILTNLKLEMGDIGFVRAELSRPELRLIRRTFKRPLAASLRSVFAHHTVVPTEEIIPTLLYSGTQNGTLEFLQLINCSRGQPNETANGLSDFARRYHASTGEKAKLSAVTAFVSGGLAVLCCTLALGLGQNWQRVRRVVVLGRQDPCNFVQMAGRGGRDGRRGLALLLVEHKRLHGKNLISDFKTPTSMTDEDRMDALGITPVCLRVALAVDLKYGYIPLDDGHWSVIEEKKRQLDKRMTACDFSNCKPEEAEALWLAQGALTNDNFDDALSFDVSALDELVRSMPEAPPSACTNARAFAFTCGPGDEIRGSPLLKSLVTGLETNFAELFRQTIGGPSDLGPANFFGPDLAWDVAKNIDLISQSDDFSMILTCEAIPGHFNCLFLAFQQWQDDFDTTPAMANAVSLLASVWLVDSIKKTVEVEKTSTKLAGIAIHKYERNETRAKELYLNYTSKDSS